MEPPREFLTKHTLNLTQKEVEEVYLALCFARGQGRENDNKTSRGLEEMLWPIFQNAAHADVD